MINLKSLMKKWCFKIGLTLVLISLITLNVNQYIDLRKASTNIIALSDSLQTTKNKLGDEVKSKKLLILDINDLKSTNNDLILEINKLSTKDKRNLIEINKLNVTIDMLEDSIKTLQPGDITIVNDSTKTYPFQIPENQWRELKWNVTVVDKINSPNIVTSSLIVDKMYMDLVINKKKEGNNIILSASSSNPYVNITDIKGSVIDVSAYNSYQKPKLFGLGIHAGYGLTLDNNVVKLAPYIGIGLSYNIIRF